MSEIKDNQVVSIEYELKEKGKDEVLDSNKGQHPLEFVVGAGTIIPGLEESIKTMKKGETKTIEVPADAAYGQRDPQAVETLPREQFAGIELEKGMQLYGQGQNGETIVVTVVDFDDNSVTIDYNHPLAGKDLSFDVTVKDVREATETEKQTGQVEHVHGPGCSSGNCH